MGMPLVFQFKGFKDVNENAWANKHTVWKRNSTYFFVYVMFSNQFNPPSNPLLIGFITLLYIALHLSPRVILPSFCSDLTFYFAEKIKFNHNKICSVDQEW